MKRVKEGVIIKYNIALLYGSKRFVFLDFRLDLLFYFPRDLVLIRHNNMKQTYRQNLQKLQEVSPHFIIRPYIVNKNSWHYLPHRPVGQVNNESNNNLTFS